MRPEILYRPLNLEHAKQVARVHAISYSGDFLACLGERFLARLYRWLASESNMIGFVAMDRGRVVGYILGRYPGPSLVRTLPHELHPALALGIARGFIVAPLRTFKHIWRRRGIIVNWIKSRKVGSGSRPGRTNPRPRCSVDSIAVVPEYRGTPVARELMSAFVSEAHDRNIPMLHLSVYSCNARARAFYEKHGWRLIGVEASTARYEYNVLSCSFAESVAL